MLEYADQIVVINDVEHMGTVYDVKCTTTASADPGLAPVMHCRGKFDYLGHTYDVHRLLNMYTETNKTSKRSWMVEKV